MPSALQEEHKVLPLRVPYNPKQIFHRGEQEITAVRRVCVGHSGRRAGILSNI